MTTNFLTKEGFQKLQEELDHLRTAKTTGSGRTFARGYGGWGTDRKCRI